MLMCCVVLYVFFFLIFQFLNEENHSAKQAKEIAVLEQTLVLLDKQLDSQLEQKNDTVR